MTDQTVFAILSGIGGRFQAILEIFQSKTEAIDQCKKALDNAMKEPTYPGYPVPGGPAYPVDRGNGITEIIWSPEDATTGYSVVECQLRRFKPATQSFIDTLGDAANEEVYVIYELGTWRIAEVMDDIAQASIRAAELVDHQIAPIPYHG
ncbi:MAG: hypothetical protein Q9166_003479 [cf. Caloplaca sp. 2 TL-2023]